MSAHPEVDDARRFSGVARLFGPAGLHRLAKSHIAVAGVGGVGSWAVEALARSGVGALTLIDLDHVSESNINRQIHALDDTVGAAKAGVMRDRILHISPRCKVTVIDDFVTAKNAPDLLPAGIDFVIDAVDQVSAKAALVAHCVASNIGVVACGGAGGRVDALMLRQDDLALTTGDALLAEVRSLLRRRYAFPLGPVRQSRLKTTLFNVPAVFSIEPRPAAALEEGGAGLELTGSPLSCSGYGSLVTVTAAMGMAAAGIAIRSIVAGPTRADDEPAGHEPDR